MKRFFTWKVFRRLLLAFAAFVTLIAVVWAVENFRGNRAWSKFKSELEAKGETLDLKSMVPPSVPDEMNLAMAPFFTNLNFQITPYPTSHLEQVESKLLQRDMAAIGIQTSDDPNRTAPEDKEGIVLAEWQQFYRGNTNYPQPAISQSAAEDVLVALSRFDAELTLLHQAAMERPLARFPIRYEDGMQMLLPHLNSMKSILRVLRLRSTAYLELGRSEEALRDTQLALRLADSIKDEPLLISFLVRTALLRLGAMFVEEGIVRHAWTDGQLKQLQDYFSKTDLLSDYQKAMRGERSFANELMEAMGRGEYSLSDLVNSGQPSQNASANWILPSGWLRQNQRHIALMHENITLPAVDPEAQRVFPEVVARGEQTIAEWKNGLPNPHNLFAPLLLPAVIKVSKGTAQQQTTVDQAMLACALERYYLKNNRYPDSLQDLVPIFVPSLPHDVITGGPLKYQRTSNGFYRLYSTGWDGKDDGGKVAEKRSNKNVNEDWVWQFPE